MPPMTVIIEMPKGAAPPALSQRPASEPPAAYGIIAISQYDTALND